MNESAAVGEVASTDDAPPSTSDSGSRAPLLERNARLALIVFIVVEVVAVGLYLWLGRGQWFFLDDWDFLANRELTSVDDLLRPHNEHWSTVGIVLYRAAWNVVGIKAYWPYQLLAIINHLAIAALLRVVMRRARCRALDSNCGRRDVRALWLRRPKHLGRLPGGLRGCDGVRADPAATG